jgi:hypothetical protein
LRRLNEAHFEICLVPQVLYEFWVVATRPAASNGLRFSPEATLNDLRRARQLFRLLLDERGLYPIWEKQVVEHRVCGKSAHDARLVAAMARHGIRHLLTANPAHFHRFTDMILWTPADVVDGEATL